MNKCRLHTHCAILLVMIMAFVGTPAVAADLSPTEAMAAGNAAQKQGDYAAAIRHYRVVVAADPQSYEARFQLARMLSFADQQAEAIRIFSELLVTSPGNSDVLLARGRTHAWQGQWAESEADLSAVTTRSPAYGDAWAALGDMYSWSDRPELAVQSYGRWIEASPADVRPYLARAKAYRAAGKLALARADLEAARARGADTKEVDGLVAALDRRAVDGAAKQGNFLWSASLNHNVSNFSPARDKWYESSVSIRRYWEQGSLALEYLDANRFSLNDQAFALDAYVDLWARAYGNFRYQKSPDAVLYPEDSYRAEVFQGYGQGWEFSGSYDRLNFTRSSVDMYGVGIGKYTGNWYYRWRTLVIPSTAKTGLSHRLIARNYFNGDADDYYELNGGFSRGGEFRSNQSQVVDLTRSWSVGVAVRKYFARNWGVKLAASYSDDQNAFRERNVSASLLLRW